MPSIVKATPLLISSLFLVLMLFTVSVASVPVGMSIVSVTVPAVNLIFPPVAVVVGFAAAVPSAVFVVTTTSVFLI